MRVCVALEQRFVRCPDGSVWTQSCFGASFWDRYLEAFDRVRCLARVRDVSRLEGTWHRVDGGAVSFVAVPYYIGVAQFLGQWRAVRAAVRGAVSPDEAYILRVPGAIGDLAWRELRGRGHPFGLEVVGDPYDVFAPGAVRHPLRPVLRWRGTRQLAAQCREACAASYVTERRLQRSYPPAGPSVSASCIVLREDAFAAAARRFRPGGPLRLVFIGSLEQYYKAPDVVIRAVALGRAHGRDWQLTMMGDGFIRPRLEQLARSLGCADAIRFTGHVADPEAVRAALDAADLFVLPSRTEGLPRAVIEAMARGLPCIGSTAGGIPELLPPEAVVPPGDAVALYQRIADVSANPAQMDRMAAENLARAHGYRQEILQPRRTCFYLQVRQATHAWLQHRPVRAGEPRVEFTDLRQ